MVSPGSEWGEAVTDILITGKIAANIEMWEHIYFPL